MKNICNIIFKTILILIISSIIGFTLLYISYNIPNNRVIKNIVGYFDENNIYINDLKNINSTNLDYYTDSLMLSELIIDGNNKLELTASNKYLFDKNPLNGLKKYLNNESTKQIDYPRYWHGYIFPLKILLLVFNLSQVKIINFYIETLLVLLICLKLNNNKLKEYIIPFILSIFFMMPMTIYKCLEYMFAYNIMLISCLFLLNYYKKLTKNKIYYYFLIIGILTSYFDFFTTPLLTLGYPLLFYMILDKSKTKEKIIKILKISLMWLIGYAGMWFLKWIISSIILHKNVILDGFKNVLYRTSTDKKIHFLSGLKENIKYSLNIIDYLMIISLLILLIYYVIKNIKSMINYNKIIPYLIISLMPIIWFTLITNHSYIHAWFTYRSLSLIIFSLGIIIVKIKNKLE